MSEIQWESTNEDNEIILAIAGRAARVLLADKMSMAMTVTATHLNGCPLRLQDLLDAKEPDFIHDITGMTRNISRRTGKLKNCFLPRYSVEGV